jgi:predicted O-linked N-acetylglucosamine transferase (SPINDLY family)
MPTLPEALTIALDHFQTGRLELAEEIYRRILAADPTQAEAWHMTGVMACQREQLAVGAERIRHAIELRPTMGEYHGNLGIALKQLGQLDEAIACYRRALELNPRLADVHNNLGIALRQQGDLAGAVACHQHALDVNPEFAEAYNGLGTAFRGQGKLDQAAACYRRALQLRPATASYHNNLGNVLKQQGKSDEALPEYRRALELNPQSVDALTNLGNLLQELCQGAEAEVCYQRALQLAPFDARAYNGLGGVRLAQGDLDAAAPYLRRALELQPDYAEARSNLLRSLQDREGVTLRELQAAHAEYDVRHAQPLRPSWQPHGNSRDPERMLRLGFVSPDLGRHPVGCCLGRVLEQLDSTQATAICYSDRLADDEITARCRTAAVAWRDVRHLADVQLTEQIRADQIDILFDLAGHTAHNRLLVFARKPAPLQITWLGYEGTTGLTAIDYLLADQHHVPPQFEWAYAEKVLRMPDAYTCFEPPADAPPVGPLPALATGRVTFGSLNNPAKITRQMVARWAEILRHVAGSRLVLQSSGRADAERAALLRGWLAACGVAPEQWEVSDGADRRAVLKTYQQIDVALDTFPASGSLTTGEALWMGVPVVTCPGETFASRHAFSHLSTVGLAETIARDRDEYVDLAVALVGDLPRLAALRAGLRERVARSPLCDGPRFAQDLTALLRDTWRRWCEGREAGRAP